MQLSLLSAEIQEFINSSLQANISKLALSKNPFPELDWKEIINQIVSKKKSNQKPKLTPNDTEENIVIESNATQIFCQSIVKYGINKGNHCSFKIHQNGLCKRHYHLLEIKNI